jgi:UDP-N-acetylglucosamine 2-epimerase (non-hydrolysing)
MLANSCYAERVGGMSGLRVIDPASYLDFIKLVANAQVVLTDSGGVQEETTILGVPCITLRDNTERPITVECGGNVLAGTDATRIVQEYRAVATCQTRRARVPPLWDGGASGRVVEILKRHVGPSQ